MATDETPPILLDKDYDAPSAFTPESLLREARRQKGADKVAVPKICLLDPDGDIVRYLKANGRTRKHEGWVCYHTDLWLFTLATRSALLRVRWVRPLPYWWPKRCLRVVANF
jgi:hypothetical protein